MAFSWDNLWNGFKQKLGFTPWPSTSTSTTATHVVEEDYEGNADDNNIPHFWHRDIDNHYYGQYSMAVLKGNQVIEDHSQVEVADGKVFCGIYDGHGGPRASRYVIENLYNIFKGLVQEQERGTFYENTIFNAIYMTESRFLELVEKEFPRNPDIVGHGTCCLIGILSEKKLYYANLGDSRAVLCSQGEDGEIVAHQLTQDHNVKDPEIRRQYQRLTGNEVLKVRNVWRVKGTLQLTRAVGDAYFKREHLARNRATRYHVRGQAHWPVVSAHPSIDRRHLNPSHRFVIFASDGLWDILTNQQAAEIVHKGTRKGAARRLVKRALKVQAQRLKLTCDELKAVDLQYRRKLIDDTSVIVLFVDYRMLDHPRTMHATSVKGFDYEAYGPAPEIWV